MLPNTSELFTRRQFAERHPQLLNKHRVDWAIRHRRENGLAAAEAVFDSAAGETLIHEPKFLEWFLGLSSRAKPRRFRTRKSAAGAQP
jgi:hypothetical protein